jgi:hypothetical protein
MPQGECLLKSSIHGLLSQPLLDDATTHEQGIVWLDNVFLLTKRMNLDERGTIGFVDPRRVGPRGRETPVVIPTFYNGTV